MGNPVITTSPLAERLRPKRFEDFVGQEHLLGEDRPLSTLVKQRSVHSMILWGPPGSGKTTLARLIAANSDAHWIAISAVLAGVKDVRAAIEEAKSQAPRQTVLFVDEVHRFNKAQQDAFLPHVESGTLTLIGATTENPAFEVNSALLSRTHVYVLYRLESHHIESIARRAMLATSDSYTLTDDGLELLLGIADGDARRALNTIEAAMRLDSHELNAEVIEHAAGQAFRQFDKGGDSFYDQISALHKAIRGSDPDASLYWFVRMVDGGCDPLYVARRLVRIATEDIGTADPRCLQLAIAARDAYHHLGSPEGELALAEAVLYFASVPKSNAVEVAYERAKAFVRSQPSHLVPLRFRNAPTALAKSLKHGEGYRYAHDEDGAFAAGERYFPDEIADQQFYFPSDRGVEKQITARLSKLRASNKRAQR